MKNTREFIRIVPYCFLVWRVAIHWIWTLFFNALITGELLYLELLCGDAETCTKSLQSSQGKIPEICELLSKYRFPRDNIPQNWAHIRAVSLVGDGRKQLWEVYFGVRWPQTTTLDQRQPHQKQSQKIACTLTLWSYSPLICLFFMAHSMISLRFPECILALQLFHSLNKTVSTRCYNKCELLQPLYRSVLFLSSI